MGRGAGRNAIFRGKRHDSKILKVKSLLSRNFVVMAQAPRFSCEFIRANGFSRIEIFAFANLGEIEMSTKFGPLIPHPGSRGVEIL